MYTLKQNRGLVSLIWIPKPTPPRRIKVNINHITPNTPKELNLGMYELNLPIYYLGNTFISNSQVALFTIELSKYQNINHPELKKFLITILIKNILDLCGLEISTTGVVYLKTKIDSDGYSVSIKPKINYRGNVFIFQFIHNSTNQIQYITYSINKGIINLVDTKILSSLYRNMEICGKFYATINYLTKYNQISKFHTLLDYEDVDYIREKMEWDVVDDKNDIIYDSNIVRTASPNREGRLGNHSSFEGHALRNTN